MINFGNEVVQVAQTYSEFGPNSTGFLRRTEHFLYNDKTYELAFMSDAPYDIFVEMGTRHMRPQPHWRPALNTVGPIFGIQTHLVYQDVPAIQHPILMKSAGFALPHTLTPKQLKHVREHLLPTSKRHHIANVSRAKVHVHRRKLP
jgi:hypothetical protein